MFGNYFAPFSYSSQFKNPIGLLGVSDLTRLSAIRRTLI